MKRSRARYASRLLCVESLAARTCSILIFAPMITGPDSFARARSAGQRRPKIAWLSPLPPQRSGIAIYSYWLIKSLKADVDIHLFSKEELSPELTANFVVHPLSAFPDMVCNS